MCAPEKKIKTKLLNIPQVNFAAIIFHSKFCCFFTFYITIISTVCIYPFSYLRCVDIPITVFYAYIKGSVVIKNTQLIFFKNETFSRFFLVFLLFLQCAQVVHKFKCHFQTKHLSKSLSGYFGI